LRDSNSPQDYNPAMPKHSATRASIAELVFKQVRDYCLRNANPALVEKYERFFTEGYDAYGLTDKLPDWEETRKRLADQLRSVGADAVFDCGDLLMATGKYEEASFAIRFVIESPEFDSRESFARIAQWFHEPRGGEYLTGIRNWAHADILCNDVLSRYLRNATIKIDDLVPWRDSQNKFQRRAVPVSFCSPMNSRNTRLDQVKSYAPMFKLIAPLMADDQRVVQQGVGWFLREAWKRYPEQTEPFLLKFKNTAPRLIYQYATEKMDKKAKLRFRKG
jgi:3-methyladenine DNA glycosylase AlkD